MGCHVMVFPIQVDRVKVTSNSLLNHFHRISGNIVCSMKGRDKKNCEFTSVVFWFDDVFTHVSVWTLQAVFTFLA